MLRATALLLASVALVHAAEEDITFRSDVSLIRVDAQVVNRSNRAITGLRVEDFVLTEEGKPQEIRNFASEEMPVDLLFLLDVSGSMRSHVQRLVDAAHIGLRAMDRKDRFAVMVFDRRTRIRMTFRSGLDEAERGLEAVLEQETFDGGTDVTRSLLDAANYIGREGRKDARRAIVILTDDQTEFDRDEASVNRALVRADATLSALIAPNALQSRSGGYGGGGGGGQQWPMDVGSIIFGRRQPPYGGRGGGQPVGSRTKSAGTSEIARNSGGDSLRVDEASALEDTLARIRQRYALHFYLPAGVRARQERNIEVALASAAQRRYPDAEVRFRRTYMSPEGDGTSSAEPPPPPVVSSSEASEREEPRPRMRRRPMVDGSSGTPDTVEVGPKPDGGWRKADEAPVEKKKGEEPKAEQPKEGGWRKLKPGEVP